VSSLSLILLQKKSVKIPEKNPSAEPLKVASQSKTKAITAPKSAGPLAWSDLPRKCPKKRCKDVLPTTINTRLLFLFSDHQSLRQKVGPDGHGVFYSESLICDAIQQEKNRKQYEELGRKNSWPTTPNFEALPTRILGMREDLFNMIKFPAILSEAFAWNNFLSNIENRLFAFSNTEFKLEYSIALFGSRSG
jgi:hypothetical protein